MAAPMSIAVPEKVITAPRTAVRARRAREGRVVTPTAAGTMPGSEHRSAVDDVVRIDDVFLLHGRVPPGQGAPRTARHRRRRLAQPAIRAWCWSGRRQPLLAPLERWRRRSRTPPCH